MEYTEASFGSTRERIVLVTGDQLRQIAGTTEMRLTEELAAAYSAILPVWGIESPLRLAHWCGQTCIETDYFRTLVEYGAADAKYAPYFGMGPLMLTWETNYVKMGGRLGLPLKDQPDRVSDPALGTIVGCIYWADYSLNSYADQDDAVAISRGINRGSVTAKDPANAEQDRIKATERAKLVLGVAATGPAVQPLDSISSVQAALHALGYYNGQIDNKAGPETRKAIKAFQEDVGLKADSVAGPATKAALKQRMIGG
jgi:putative chitinase